MALNDGMLDDLPQQTTDSSTEVKTEPVAVDEEVLISEEGMAAMGQTAQQLSMVVQSTGELSEKKEIAGAIADKDAISRNDVLYAEECFKDIVKGSVRINEFTQTPSMVNFNYVVRHMGNVIAKEEEQVVSAMAAVDANLTDAQTLLNDVKENYYTKVSVKLLLSAGKYNKLGTIMDGPDRPIVYLDDEFTNLVDIPLESLDFSKFKDFSNVKGEPISGSGVFNETVANLNTLFEDKLLKAFVFTVADSKPFDILCQEEAKAEAFQRQVTLADLVRFYTTGMLDGHIDDMVKLAETTLGVISTRSEAIRTVTETSEQAKVISDNITAIESHYTLFKAVLAVLNSIITLDKEAVVLMDFLNSNFVKE